MDGTCNVGLSLSLYVCMSLSATITLTLTTHSRLYKCADQTQPDLQARKPFARGDVCICDVCILMFMSVFMCYECVMSVVFYVPLFVFVSLCVCLCECEFL